jgi:hypothetical protein
MRFDPYAAVYASGYRAELEGIKGTMAGEDQADALAAASEPGPESAGSQTSSGAGEFTVDLATAVRPASAGPSGKTKDKPSWTQLRSLIGKLKAEVIEPTRHTQRVVLGVGIAFYLILFVGVVVSIFVLNTPLTTVASIAIGTGGAVAYLQGFQGTVNDYLRTDQMLQNITKAWDAELKKLPTRHAELLKQVDGFIEALSAMPAPYSPGGSKG